MVRIGQALREMVEEGENLFAIAATYLLFFLGRRLQEVLGIKWTQIDTKARTIRWSDTKTGAASAPLNDEAWEIISALPRMTYKNKDGEIVEHPYILPGKLPGKPMHDIRSFWKRLLAKAEVENLWRHDLRHAHGNESADLGQNPQTTAALLGHADMASTNRYSKTGRDRRLEASQRVAGSLSNKLRGMK
jgi:integrase